jgi:hypothetical protein
MTNNYGKDSGIGDGSADPCVKSIKIFGRFIFFMYFCSMKRLLIIAFTLLTSITPSKAYEIVSLGAALDIYKSGLATIAEQTLAGLSYDYFGQDPNGTHYWAQGCRLNSNFELSSTMDATKLPLGASIVRFNPNDSVYAIEGITSPDGRVFGKMGHSERVGNGLYKNVEGEYDIKMFDSAVKYFK